MGKFKEYLEDSLNEGKGWEESIQIQVDDVSATLKSLKKAGVEGKKGTPTLGDGWVDINTTDMINVNTPKFKVLKGKIIKWLLANGWDKRTIGQEFGYKFTQMTKS